MQTSFPLQSQLHTFSHVPTSFISLLPRVLVVAILLAAGIYILWLVIIVVRRSLNLFRLHKRELVFLELTPLAHTHSPSIANQQFFTGLHGFHAVRSITDRLLDRRMVFSAEVVGTRKDGVRFVLCVPAEDREQFKRAIHSLDPDMQVREMEDYLNSFSGSSRVAKFSLKSRYYPLATESEGKQSDPVAYLLSAFKNLGPDEMIALQLVLTPSRFRSAERIARRMLQNHEHMDKLGGRQGSVGSSVLRGISSALFAATDAVGDLHHGSPGHGSESQHGLTKHRATVAAGIKPARAMGTLETELSHAVSEKLNEPLYYADIRAMVSGAHARIRMDEIGRSFSVYRTSYQALVKRPQYPFLGRYREYVVRHRLPNVFGRDSSILSASEVASIYHIPNTPSHDVVKSLSKSLPTPRGIRNRADDGAFDVLIGEGTHHGESVPIGLTAPERERHMFIVGGTGNGKSTLMKYAVVQDIKNGKGVALLDPHGELAQEILEYIPEERMKDVVYFNPSDLSYPIGLNILEVPAGLTGDELLDAKDFIAETVVSIMRKTFSDDAVSGHRVEYILRNAVLAAFSVKRATLFTVYDILTNSKFRRRTVEKLEDDWLKNFWNNEFGKAGEFQQVKMMAGVTSKIGRYRASVSASRILSQPKSTINFDEILDGKILICNLAKGLIGEDTSEILGIAVLAELQLAAYRRIKQKKDDRKPFYAYVDEFQNFATTSFVEMLSEARKYKLFLTMAEQTTSQQDDDRMVNTILANAGSIVCFKTNSLADEQQMLHLFEPYLTKGQLANLPAFTFYAKLSGGLQPQEPLSGRTVLLEEAGREEMATQVIQESRRHYARQYEAPIKATKSKKNQKNQGGTTSIRAQTTD